MMKTTIRLAILSASAGGALLSGPAAAQLAVFDPSVFARQFEQLTEMKKQVETLTSQLKVAQEQLGQAKQLYDSFNKLTNVNDIASLLNSSEFRKYLPSEFSQIEGLIKGTGSDGFSSVIDSYLRNNRYYTQNGQFLLRLRARAHRTPDRDEAVDWTGCIRYCVEAHRRARKAAPADQRLEGCQGRP